MPADWRAFEKLAAGIEEALVPKGAVVKSPDRIPDLVTGQPREVDASIRLAGGSASILITIECRRSVGQRRGQHGPLPLRSYSSSRPGRQPLRYLSASSSKSPASEGAFALAFSTRFLSVASSP